MKTVALVSGGKDSCYNMMHCIRNEHEIVALANLHPPGASDDSDTVLHEMDSFMYQTVGHTVLGLYSECLGVPMYRGEITGKPVDSNLEYAKAVADETEDLFSLLLNVKQQIPDLEAVSVGAILSTYQRTRVESVCSRLGLVSLSYLWNRNEDALFNEMIDAGVHAILIKVAGEGLSTKHLGLTLQQIRPTLVRAHELYDAHICGEGGEYETLVLDSPIFIKKLVVDRQAIVAEPTGSVAYLKVVAHVEEKIDEVGDWKSHVAVPDLFESAFQKLMSLDITPFKTTEARSIPVIDKIPTVSFGLAPSGTAVISNITVSNCFTIGEEVKALFTRALEIMSESKLSDSLHIVYVSLLLADMSDFVAANAGYKTVFQKPLPPARACVSTLLPTNCRASLSVIVESDLSFRKGLHVQGRSYWAPANIGPYSQAIKFKECIYLAGQIPLMPPSMTLYTGPDLVHGQAVLALQNLYRVAEVMNGFEPNEFSPISFYYLVALTVSQEASAAVINIMQSFNLNCGMFAVQVTALPAGAHVEFSAVAIDAKFLGDQSYDDDSNDEIEYKVKVKRKNEFCEVAFGQAWYRTFCVDAVNLKSQVWLPSSANHKILSVTIYLADPSFAVTELKEYLGFRVAIDVVHVHSVTDISGASKIYGVVIKGYLDSTV
ncbi:hypothetical protein V1512DRAFT_13141 [Lipomyces arxii]|uniref:uncharacterized protein n=1 Tax=Lipomyces arxii TaxID=56418 RepID=UPI0034CF2115